MYRQYMQQYRRIIDTILDKWPLRKQLGFYAYLPIFFAAGAWTEFTMIHMRINGIDFYSIYMRKQRERLEQQRYVSFCILFIFYQKKSGKLYIKTFRGKFLGKTEFTCGDIRFFPFKNF